MHWPMWSDDWSLRMWGTNGFLVVDSSCMWGDQWFFGWWHFKLKQSVGRSLLLRKWGSNGFWSLIVQTETNSTEKEYLSIKKTDAVECVSFFFELSCMRSCLETSLHKAGFSFLFIFFSSTCTSVSLLLCHALLFLDLFSYVSANFVHFR